MLRGLTVDYATIQRKLIEPGTWPKKSYYELKEPAKKTDTMWCFVFGASGKQENWQFKISCDMYKLEIDFD